MPECREIKDRLGRYLDGELPPVERRLVENHLRKCSRCSSELQELRAIAGLFQESMHTPAVPPGLTQMVMKRAHAQIDGGLPIWNFLLFWRNWSFGMRLAALGVAAVACYVGLMIGSSSLPSTRSPGAELTWIRMTSQEPIARAYTGSNR